MNKSIQNTFIQKLSLLVLLANLFLTSLSFGAEPQPTWTVNKKVIDGTSASLVLTQGAYVLTYSFNPGAVQPVQDADFEALEQLISSNSGAFYGVTKSLPHKGYRMVFSEDKKFYMSLTVIYAPFTNTYTYINLRKSIPLTKTELTEPEWMELETFLKSNWQTPSNFLKEPMKKPSYTKIPSYVIPKKSTR